MLTIAEKCERRGEQETFRFIRTRLARHLVKKVAGEEDNEAKGMMRRMRSIMPPFELLLRR